MSEQSDFEVEISVTRSAGDDRAVLVLIDTSFEPFAPGDDDLGLRVLLNDNEIYVGKPYDLGAHHDAPVLGEVDHVDATIEYLRGERRDVRTGFLADVEVPTSRSLATRTVQHGH